MRRVSAGDNILYIMFSLFSLLFRIFLCKLTIEKIPIFTGFENSDFFDLISLYMFLMIGCRKITRIFYNKKYDKPLKGAITYFIIYLIALLIMMFVMTYYTKKGILPIAI